MSYTARRHDGWTAERQRCFLDTLAKTRSITKAAAAAGMSRKSAYALRGRAGGAAFADAWDRATVPPPPAPLAPIDEIVVPLTRRGVLLATRRRFDNARAMARLNRLDKVVARLTWEEIDPLEKSPRR